VGAPADFVQVIFKDVEGAEISPRCKKARLRRGGGGDAKTARISCGYDVFQHGLEGMTIIPHEEKGAGSAPQPNLKALLLLEKHFRERKKIRERRGKVAGFNGKRS